MSESDRRNKSCFGSIFSLGCTALIMWLFLRTTKPSISIQYFYVPALNTTLNSISNTSFNMELKLKNTNKNKGVYYDNIDVTFYDNPGRLNIIGNLTIPGFYQGHGKAAKRMNSVETHNVKWADLQQQANMSKVFWVDLVTAVRYKIMSWKTKRERIEVGAQVVVNDQGIISNKKDIKLKSEASKPQSYAAQALVLVNIVLILSCLDF